MLQAGGRAASAGVTVAVDGTVPPSAGLSSSSALVCSSGITLLALFLFGYVKGRLTGLRPWRGGLYTVGVGSLAAVAAFAIARLFG